MDAFFNTVRHRVAGSPGEVRHHVRTQLLPRVQWGNGVKADAKCKEVGIDVIDKVNLNIMEIFRVI